MVWVEEPRAHVPNRTRRRSSRMLPLHLEVRDHSPSGFAWGYGGSGPAQLALALLIDATGNEATALQNYQELKRQFVTGWGNSWQITASTIRAFVCAQQNG